MEAATREFAEKGYEKGSIQVIADEAGVAKGSMYQYFQNKKELFFYILELAGEAKLQLSEEVMKENPKYTFFGFIEAMFYVSIRFSNQHPELYQIYQELQYKAPLEIRKEYQEKMNQLGQQHYKAFILKGIEEGEIRKDIELDLAVHVLYSLLQGFGNYLIEQDVLSTNNKSKKLVKEFMKLLKDGFSSKNGE